MNIRHGMSTVWFYFIALSLSVSTLAYETDPTKEEAFNCPGYANCTGDECRYNRISPISGWNPFNKNEKAAMNCDSLDVEFNFPESKDESFVGNKTWTCFRYYDAVGHHLAILKITLNKPSDVNGTQVDCKVTIGECALFNETSSEMIFIAGLPKNCVRWTDETTTQGSSETTTQGSSVARLEFASVLALAAALFMRQYL